MPCPCLLPHCTCDSQEEEEEDAPPPLPPACSPPPSSDALEALERYGWGGAFDALVAMEDAALKPDPAPVRLALARLREAYARRLGGGSAAEAEAAALIVPARVAMVGDTVDDVRAAVAAGVTGAGARAGGRGGRGRVDARPACSAACMALVQASVPIPPTRQPAPRAIAWAPCCRRRGPAASSSRAARRSCRCVGGFVR